MLSVVGSSTRLGLALPRYYATLLFADTVGPTVSANNGGVARCRTLVRPSP